MKEITLLCAVFLLIFTAETEAAYLIRLKNGGELATYHYWPESGRIMFFWYGGIVGIGAETVREIEKIDYIPLERDYSAEKGNAEKKAPAAGAAKEKSPAANRSPDVIKGGAEKADIEPYRTKKVQMQSELDALMEKRRKATAGGDIEEKKRLTEEIRLQSGDIYNLTDEATQRNKGKLPEGWWDK